MDGVRQRLPDKDTEMADLPGTGVYPPQVEVRVDEDIITPNQVSFPQDMEEEKAEWEEWDDYPLGVENSEEDRNPAYRPFKENKRKKREKGVYHKKRLREADKEEGARSESEWEELDEDPLGLEQAADKRDPAYRPYKMIKEKGA